MTIKCIIVDDEPLARKVIKNLLQNFDQIELVAECKNAVQAFEVLSTSTIDLMFLDIQMPQVTGIDFLKSLSNAPDVIITTAYRDYAVESYDLNVIDYLVKPISLDRFLKSIDKFYKKTNTSNQINGSHQNGINKKPFIYVKENKKTNKIFLSDIIYLESKKEYVHFITNHRKVITKSTLSKYEASLPEKSFIRIHNSYIISIAQIRSFSMTLVEISTGQELPISRSYRINVMSKLNSI